MDEFVYEQAAKLEEDLRADALAEIRRELEQRRRDAEEFDGQCLSCGSDVPPARSRLGFFDCVDCVEERERRRRTGS